MEASRYCTVPLSALLLAAAMASPTSAQNPAFAQPEYVQALIAGEADRLANRDPLPWDSFLREAAAGLKMTVPEAAALLKIEKAGPPPAEAFASALSPEARTAALLEWQRKSDQELLSTHARRLVFRAHYVFAFALQLNERCAVLSQGLARAAAEAKAAATKDITLDGAAYTPLDGRPEKQLQGAKLLNAHLLAGQSDAERLVGANGCQAAPVRSASATLSRLLAPLEPGRLRTDPETQAELAGMRKDDGKTFLIAGRLYRPYPSQGPYSSATIGNRDEPTYRVPGPGQQVAGVTIGWHSVRDGLLASKADGKLVLIAFFRKANCDRCPQFLFDLLNSASLNALAGRFNAVLLTEDDELADKVASRYADLQWPSISVLRLATPQKPTIELLRLQGKMSIRSMTVQLDAASAAEHAAQTDIKPQAVHAASTRLPPFCWLIETYELCRARIRRDPQGE